MKKLMGVGIVSVVDLAGGGHMTSLQRRGLGGLQGAEVGFFLRRSPGNHNHIPQQGQWNATRPTQPHHQIVAGPEKQHPKIAILPSIFENTLHGSLIHRCASWKKVSR